MYTILKSVRKLQNDIVSTVIKSLFDYNGRLNRVQFIGYNLVSVAMLVGALSFITLFYKILKLAWPDVDVLVLIPSVMLLVVIIAYYYSNACMAIKRLHDMSLPGTYYIFILALNIIGLQFHLDVLTYTESMTFVLGNILLAMIPGTKGENQYNEITTNQ